MNKIILLSVIFFSGIVCANPFAIKKPVQAPVASEQPAQEPELKPEPAVKPEPVKPEPVKPEPAKPEPAKPEPAKPEPVKPEPAKPEPSSGVSKDFPPPPFENESASQQIPPEVAAQLAEAERQEKEAMEKLNSLHADAIKSQKELNKKYKIKQ